MLHSLGKSVNFLIFSQLPKSTFNAATSRWYFSNTSGSFIASSFEVYGMPLMAHHDCRVAKFGTIKADGNLRFSPTTMTCSIKVDSLNLFSISCGAIYLPPAVLNISFFLSVIRKKPSGVISPISPV